MIYTYRVSGNDGDNQDDFIVVDTESTDFQHRIAWLSEMAGLEPPAIRNYLNRSPNTAGGNVASGESLTYYGNAEWTKDGKVAAADVRVIMGNPVTDMRGVIAWLSVELGLGLSAEAVENMIYQAPTAAETKDDWEVAGAIIGGPMPGKAGWFESRKLGHREGDTWRGTSGSSYRLEYIPGFAFFRPLAWRKL